MQLDWLELPGFLDEVPGEVLLAIAAVVVLAVVLLISVVRVRRRRRHAELEERFGGEYERTLVSSGSRRRAETALKDRMQERRSYDVRPLDPAERADFSTRLRDLESGFLEAPDRSAGAALDLVYAVAEACGYPNGGRERCLDLLSVDHPQFVADLRRELARARTTSATERRRRVVLRARTLVERLLSDGRSQDEPASWTQIKTIVEERRFRTMFQPIFSLDDGRTRSLEALTQFDIEPRRPPEVWFQQAAAVGLATELELAAIEAALDATRELPVDVAVSMNASPQTLDDQRLEQLVASQRDRQVIIEVTEHAIVRDYEGMTRAIEALREHGVRLAIDNTGAGLSSLHHLVRLAPDLIKLDRSLTREVLADPVRQALASSLVHFAHRIEAELIVEGIERQPDLAAWQDLGAHAAQGDLLAPAQPLPVPLSCETIIPRPRVFVTTPEATAAGGTPVGQASPEDPPPTPSSDEQQPSTGEEPQPWTEEGRTISLEEPEAGQAQRTIRR